MAEREGFEPAIRFCRAKARRVRKLQIAKPAREFHAKTRHQSFAISPVSIRHPFVPKRRTLGDSVARMVTLRFPGIPDGVRRGLRAYCAVRKRKIYPQGVLQECSKKGPDKWEFLEILRSCFLTFATWLRIGDNLSLSDLLVSSERANFLESDLQLESLRVHPEHNSRVARCHHSHSRLKAGNVATCLDEHGHKRSSIWSRRAVVISPRLLLAPRFRSRASVRLRARPPV
jgi:hypothetical protein